MDNSTVERFQTAAIRSFQERVGQAPIIIICGLPDDNHVSLRTNIGNVSNVEHVLMDLLESVRGEQLAHEFTEDINQKLEEPPEDE